MNFDTAMYCVTFNLHEDFREDPNFWFQTLDEALSFIKVALTSSNGKLNATIQDHSE